MGHIDITHLSKIRQQKLNTVFRVSGKKYLDNLVKYILIFKGFKIFVQHIFKSSGPFVVSVFENKIFFSLFFFK